MLYGGKAEGKNLFFLDVAAMFLEIKHFYKKIAFPTQDKFADTRSCLGIFIDQAIFLDEFLKLDLACTSDRSQ